MATYQVNYKYIHANGKIRSAAYACVGKDVNEAKKKATEEIKKEYDNFEITSVKTFGGQ